MKKLFLTIALSASLLLVTGCADDELKTITHDDAKLINELHINGNTILQFELGSGEIINLYWSHENITLKKDEIYTIKYHNDKDWTNPMTVMNIKFNEKGE